MGVVSTDGHDISRKLLKPTIIAVGGAFLLNELLRHHGTALYGLLVGLVMTHFVIDAGVWRLREPFQRAYMRRKFAFVFDR